MAMTKVGYTLAKVLGIKLDYRNEQNENISRGESVFSISSADTYVEDEPHSGEWLGELLPTGSEIKQFFVSMMPFLQWIHRYNVQWLIGDLIAGMLP